MRTLNRPMFNMGGPIKQGIMHGIREPYRGGQLVQPGPGRPGYAGPPKSKLGIAGWLAKKVPFLKQPVSTVSKSTKDIIPRTWKKISDYYKTPVSTSKELVPYDKALAAKQMPGIGTNRWWWQKTAKPALGFTKRTGQAILPYAATGGLGYGGYRGIKGLFGDKTIDENIDINTVIPGTDKDYGPHTKGEATITQEMRDKMAQEAKDKRVNNLLEIMGYDKAKKNAAYDALIDAGRIINERGTLEAKNINRELIDPIIAATSKRFDKPQDIREAVGLLMAKGEIEKDIAKSKGDASTQAINALAAASGRSPQYVANTKLGIANTVAEAKTQLAKIKKGVVVSDDVATVTMNFAEENGIPFKKHISTEQKNEVVGKDKKYPTVIEMLTDMKLDPAGGDDGLYVIGTTIVEVKEGIPKLKG